jgi:transposase
LARTAIRACAACLKQLAIRACAACLKQLAWRWLRFQPESALSRWFAERTGGAKGRIRKIMIVALARKLLVALWRYVETGEVPAGARTAAP